MTTAAAPRAPDYFEYRDDLGAPSGGYGDYDDGARAFEGERREYERFTEDELERLILQDLNPPQRDAVTSTEGPLMIVAGPGSGKTMVISSRVAYLVRGEGVFPYRIAVVTFTNKAAKELKLRLEMTLGIDAEQVAASTFHSFCAQVLRRDGEAIGLKRDFGVYDDADQMKIMDRAMRELNIDPGRISPRAVLSAVSSAKSSLIPADALLRTAETPWESTVARVYERYDDILRLSSSLDFDDLLVKTFLLFAHHEDVAQKYQERFRHFMIDEFQDTNVAQYAIARQVSALYRNICVVGDPDQSIYGWRNADIRNILDFERDFPDGKRVDLEENYRSSSNILEGARGVIAVNTQRVEKGLWTMNAYGDPIRIRRLDDGVHEARFVASEVAAGVLSGLSYEDFAVSYRTNAQARLFEDAFMREGVPYQVIGGQKFYARQEIKDALAYLRVLSNPDDEVSFARIVNTPPRGVGATTLGRLTDLARSRGMSRYAAIPILSGGETLEGEGGRPLIAPKASAALLGFYDLLETARARLYQASVPEVLAEILTYGGYYSMLEKDSKGEDRLDNLRELMNAAEDYSSGEEGLASFLQQISLSADIDRKDDDINAVTLITLHQAKGLEYPVMFVCGVEEDLLPHYRSVGDELEIEEERRLFYVGMTRAMRTLYLTRADYRTLYGERKPKEPSRFLADVPSENVDMVDLTGC